MKSSTVSHIDERDTFLSRCLDGSACDYVRDGPCGREARGYAGHAALHILLADRWREPEAARRHDERRAGHARSRTIGGLEGSAGKGLVETRTGSPRHSGDGGYLSRDVRFSRGHLVRCAAIRPNAPYQSWGTEKVYVDADNGRTISLVHILEMRIVQQDGSISEPMVTKHWRQDWNYEPTHIVEYKGSDRWERRALSAPEARGNWMQSVYQVDESPRYASVGAWQHSASFSTWASGDTWRPLPRREWSVRDDYQVLLGTNRHTIGPAGWVQEENNLKAVLNATRQLDAARPYVGREYGVARYERTAMQTSAARIATTSERRSSGIRCAIRGPTRSRRRAP